MIVSHLDFLDREKPLLSPLLYRGLEFLAAADFAGRPAGRLDIAGEALFAQLQDYVPEEKPSRRPEAHARYIDIHYMLEGRETMGYAPLPAGLAPEEDLLAERDVAFYRLVGDETDVLLTPGTYAVVFPWEIHRPGCAVDANSRVRKVVVKILLG